MKNLTKLFQVTMLVSISEVLLSNNSKEVLSLLTLKMNQPKKLWLSMLKSLFSVTQVKSTTVTLQSSIAIPLTSPVNLNKSKINKTEEPVKLLKKILNVLKLPTPHSSLSNQPKLCVLNHSKNMLHLVDSLLEIWKELLLLVLSNLLKKVMEIKKPTRNDQK